MDRKKKIPDFVASKWRENMKIISSELRDLFDYQRMQREVFYYRPKKSDETAAQNAEFFNAIETAQRAFAFSDNGIMNETVRNGVQSSIDYWDAKKEKIVLNSKDDRRIYYACAFNAANTYFQLNDYDKALSYVPSMIKADIDNGEAESFAKVVNTAKMRAWQHNDWKEKLKNGQVSLYLNGAMPAPAANDAPAKNVSPRGYIVLKNTSKVNPGAKIEGTLNNFLPNLERLRLKILDDNGNAGLYFLSDVQEIKTDDVYYRTLRYPTDILSSKTDLVEVIYETPRVGLYRAFETVKGLDGTSMLRQGALLIKKGNEEKCVNLEIGSFASSFNARLSEYFDDCTSVSTKAKNGQYSLQNVRTAVSEYNDCK